MLPRSAHIAGAVILAALALPSAAQAAPPAYYPSGPQQDVPRSTPKNGGWSVCFKGGYDGNKELGPILDACDGAYLMLAAGPAGSGVFTVLAAAPREDVLFDMGTQDQTHLSNGTGWYFSDDYSWGFAGGGDEVNRNSCDVASTNPEDRLCWHTDDGLLTSGWRAGEHTGIGSPDFDRLILESNDGRTDDGTDGSDDDSDDGDDDDDAPAPVTAPVEQAQQQQPTLPEPLSSASLFGTRQVASASASGLFAVPGMMVTCGVGPCPTYERVYIAKSARASSHGNARHGMVSRDRDVLASGQSSAVRMRLTRSANRKLRRAGRLRVEAMVTVSDARGRSQLTRKTFTIRAPRG